jgi:hypothetical protein
MGLRYKKANVTVSSGLRASSNIYLTLNLASGTRRYCSITYNKRQEEPPKPNVYTVRRSHKGYNY